MVNKSTKSLTIVEAELLALIVNKMNASQYEFNEELKYLKIEYSKESDGILIQTTPDANAATNRVTILQAELVAWVIPQINNIERNLNIAISSFKTKFSKVDELAEIEVVHEPIE